jgi:hypothetical protein
MLDSHPLVARGERIVSPTIATALLVLSLTGCTMSGQRPIASSPTRAPSTSGNQPLNPGTIALTWHEGSLPGVDLDGHEAVLLSPTRLAFRSAGSGSCPSLPRRLDVLAPSTIQLVISPYTDHHGCTSDLTVTTVEVAIDPSVVDVGQNLSIQLVNASGGSYTTIVAPGLR